MVKRFRVAICLLVAGCGGSSGSDLGDPPAVDAGREAESAPLAEDSGPRADSGRDAMAIDSGAPTRDSGAALDSGATTIQDSGAVDAKPPCVPKTCASALRDCGSSSDGCGGTIDCGSCELPWICDEGTPTATYTCTTAADGGRELSCDPATCPMGCCDSFGRCQVGADNNECGGGGKSCVDCQGTASPTCNQAARVCQ